MALDVAFVYLVAFLRMASREERTHLIEYGIVAAFMAIVARLAMAPQPRPGWRVCLLWLLAGAVGWGVGLESASFGDAGGLKTLRSSPSVILPAHATVS